jgi:hypothetical protein
LGRPEALVIIVGNDRLQVEGQLLAGGFGCPVCSGVLRPWGSARRRVLRCAVGEAPSDVVAVAVIVVARMCC